VLTDIAIAIDVATKSDFEAIVSLPLYGLRRYPRFKSGHFDPTNLGEATVTGARLGPSGESYAVARGELRSPLTCRAPVGDGYEEMG
jgi:hypothetical protein